jgi:hypothetical protein
MNKKAIFSLIAGMAIGACATSRYFKKKYELIAQEEIDSVKAALSRHMADNPVENDDKPKQKSKLQSEALKAFRRYSGSENEERTTAPGPYVISPDEFGCADGYDAISLTYYSGNGVLVDDNEEQVDNVEELVGEDSLKHFGEYEDDSVYVRNDERKCDYEILLDESNYYGGD